MCMLLARAVLSTRRMCSTNSNLIEMSLLGSAMLRIYVHRARTSIEHEVALVVSFFILWLYYSGLLFTCSIIKINLQSDLFRPVYTAPV